MANKGKDFENHFKKLVDDYINLQLNLTDKTNCSIDRFYDNIGGFKGIGYPSDYVAFKSPFEYYFELKSTAQKSFPLKNMSNSQYNKLLFKRRCKGVIAGLVIWHYKFKSTYFVPIESVKAIVDLGKKSFNIDILKENNLAFVTITGRQKRLFCDYNIEEMFKNLEEFEVNYERNEYK